MTTLLKGIRDWRSRRRTRARFRRSYEAFLRNPSRQTTMDAQSLLRNAFLATRGECLAWARERQRAISPHVPSDVSSPLFPRLSAADIGRAVAALGRDGYFVMPWRLPPEWIDSVRDALSQLPAEARGNAGDVQQPARLVPKSATYWHRPGDLLAVPGLRQLVDDAAVREICGRTLGCRPVLDVATAWWSYPTAAADSASAQKYHYDLDRVRWLKVFVYLNDVTEANGPHAYVRGSHETVGRFVKEDRRYEDEEVFRWYPRSDEVVFTAPAGTIFFEDTLGFHKGIPVRAGHRAIFECEFSINHFGYPYPEC